MIILAQRWWSLALRGLAAIIFGILAFAFPGSTFAALVILFGVYAIFDGVLNLIMALRTPGERWGWFVFEGIVSLVAGVLTLLWPRISALVLLLVIASWSILTGILEIAAAIRLRKEIEGEWLLALMVVLPSGF